MLEALKKRLTSIANHTVMITISSRRGCLCYFKQPYAWLLEPAFITKTAIAKVPVSPAKRCQVIKLKKKKKKKRNPAFMRYSSCLHPYRSLTWYLYQVVFPVVSWWSLILSPLYEVSSRWLSVASGVPQRRYESLLSSRWHDVALGSLHVLTICNMRTSCNVWWFNCVVNRKKIRRTWRGNRCFTKGQFCCKCPRK